MLPHVSIRSKFANLSNISAVNTHRAVLCNERCQVVHNMRVAEDLKNCNLALESFRFGMVLAD